MSRSHALQRRAGNAHPLAVRFSDEQLQDIARLAENTGRSPSALIRDAVDHHLLIRSQPMVSAFWTSYGTALEQLFVAGIRPVVVGQWAAIAHGYVATAPRMQLVIADNEAPALAAFLEARGARHTSLPTACGREPWAVEFLSSWGSKPAGAIATQTFRCGRINVAVATLEELLRSITLMPAWSHEDLWALRDGTYRNDDGSRGEAAWDYAGRMNASATYATPQRGGAHFFIDFRRALKLVNDNAHLPP